MSRVPIYLLETEGQLVPVADLEKVAKLERYATVLEYLAMYATHYDYCDMVREDFPSKRCSCGFVSRLTQVEAYRL